MAMSLRIAFLVSGMLHIAAAVAFSLVPKQATPVLDQPRPIDLTLAVSRLRQVAEAAPPVEAASSPEIIEALKPQPDIVPAATRPPITRRQPASEKRLAVNRAHPKPRVVVEPAVKTDAAPEQNMRVRSKPALPSPATRTIAAVAGKPQKSETAIDMQATQHYLAALAAQIDRNKFYPRASRRRGEEGMVVVSFVLQRDGELTELTVAESSGVRRLDEAALKTLQRITPFKPIPGDLDRERWPISVPIAFSLRG